MDKLDKLPTSEQTFFIQCKYCEDTNMGHERELMDKAHKLCKKLKTSHLPAYLTAQMDRLDHAKLDKIGQIEVLSALHHRTGCDCLTASIDQLQHDTQSDIPSQSDQPDQPDNSDQSDQPDNSDKPDHSQQAHLSAQTPTSPTIRTNQHKPRKPPTLLERLQVGPRSTPS